jgi:hypothetical protein
MSLGPPSGAVDVRFSIVTSPKSGLNVIVAGAPTTDAGFQVMSMLLSLKPSPDTGAAYHQLRS